MIRYILSAICIVICVALQMGWKEVASMYHLNYSTNSDIYVSEGGDSGRETESVHWTDIYASANFESALDVAAITDIDQLMTTETNHVLTSTSWNQIHNTTEYTVETRSVKSNSMSITENPMIRIRMDPLPCRSAEHMLQQAIAPHSIMSTFFPLFHIYESKAAEFAADTDDVTSQENEKEEEEKEEEEEEEEDIAAGSKETETADVVSASRSERSRSTTPVELRTVIAPLIWPLEERYNTNKAGQFFYPHVYISTYYISTGPHATCMFLEFVF
jgi:hypothetical protein